MNPLLSWALGWGALVLFTSIGCAEDEEDLEALGQSANALVFEEIPLTTRASQDLVLTNTGTVDVLILSSDVIEGSADVWRLGLAGDGELAPGELFTITVTFVPLEVGEFEGRLRVRTDLASIPTLDITLSGSAGLSTVDADNDGYSEATGDCDDADATIHPDAEELCDGVDNDCDGVVPEDEANADADGYRVCDGDCDDDDAQVYPGAPEICDDKDTACTGDPPDREDADQDGWTYCDGDCDDDEALANPGQAEVCDFIDNDCNGLVDDLDSDGDGFSACIGGGDCDDSDPDIHPVLVDGDAAPDGDGSLEFPFDTLRKGVNNRDETCGAVVMRPGFYELSTVLTSGRLHLIGSGTDPDDVFLTPERSGTPVVEVQDGASLVLENLLVTGAENDEDGGVVHGVVADITLTRVVAIDNQCSGDGGVLSLSSGTLTITDSVFTANTASDDGGVLSVLSSIVSDSGSQYDGNVGVRGGAIVLEASDYVGVDLVFEGNEASHLGGALAASGGSVVLERSELLSNTAEYQGGALSLTDVFGGASLLRNLAFQDNVAASSGGAVAILGDSSDVVFANNTLTGNVADGDGAGVFADVTDASGLVIWSNVFVWSDGHSAVKVGEGSGASVAYNHTYLTTSGTGLDIGSDEDDGNNEVGDPALSLLSNDGDPSNDDLTLKEGSPVIDAGPPDGEGPAIYQSWSDLDGSRNDRGMTGGPGAG